MSHHPVFVPSADSFAFKTIAKGSAIVGKPSDNGGHIVYYEGNLYQASNIVTFEDKAMIAASRMDHSYPTIAKQYCREDELIKVGMFDTLTNTFQPYDDDDATQALSEWIQGEEGDIF